MAVFNHIALAPLNLGSGHFVLLLVTSIFAKGES